MTDNNDKNQSAESVSSLYPDFIPAEEGHPTSAKFVVRDTGDVRGRGVSTKVAFDEGDRVARVAGVIAHETTLDTLQITPTLHVSDPWFCRFLLHSCDPNLELDLEHLHVTALKNIAAGEYLTIDYANTDDTVAVQFACQCGAENCRGWITGRAQEISAEGRAYIDQQK